MADLKPSAAEDDQYEILNQIGRGSYANVYKAINRKTGEICGIKKIPVTFELTNLVNEIGIMRNCDCKNIVRFLTSWCSDKDVSIVMEYCCGGSVKDVMRHLSRTMNREQIIVIIKDVLNGLDYLHAQNKIHRDVKAANILLNEDGIAKLGDFGVSESIDASARKRSIIGTLLWLPPEVINQDPYGPVIDIWSLGITVIEMGDGQPPYSDLEQNVALKEIANPNKPPPTFRCPDKWHQDLMDFLELCLAKDSSKRKNAKELLAHDIFKTTASHSIIKSLVNEVCLNNFKNETSLGSTFAHLLKEAAILWNIHQERKRKVIWLDQMAESLVTFGKEFEESLNRLVGRDTKIMEKRGQLSQLTQERAKLERDVEELRSSLKSCKDRRQRMKVEIHKIREAQKVCETISLQRLQKLRSLAG